MSLSIGFPNAAGITIGGKSATTIRASGDATADAATQALGTKKSDGTQVKTGQVGLGESADAQAESQTSDNTSVTVKVLLKRLKELQQQLAQAQAASYPTPQAKTTAVAAIEGQVADTNGAILQVSASLIKELAKGSGTGSVVNTTA